MSCMSRAGCSAGMFSASKQCHSSSTSGPSTTAKPMRVKMSSMLSRTIVSGCRWPSARPRPGSVTSTAPAGARVRGRRFETLRPARFEPASARWRQLPSCFFCVGRARCASVCIHDGDDAVLAAEIAVADAPARRAASSPRRAPSNAGERRDFDAWHGLRVGTCSGCRLQGRRRRVDSRPSEYRVTRKPSSRRSRRGLRGVFARAFACCASLANAAGLAMASSDRLLRSSVTPAFLRPLMNWP